MNANELMIGDWVHYRGTNIRVTSLYDKGGSNEIGWGDKESTWVNGRTVEPIPLTSEILERNGFRYHAPERGMYGVTSASYYDCEGSPHIFCDGDPFAVWFESGVDIRYVHQLQHVLRLCGVEKEIKLED